MIHWCCYAVPKPHCDGIASAPEMFRGSPDTLPEVGGKRGQTEAWMGGDPLLSDSPSLHTSGPTGARFLCLSHVGGVGLCEMPDCFVMKWPISPVWWAAQGARGRTSARVLSPISSSAVPSPYLSFKQNSFHWLSWVPWGLIVVYKGLWNPKWSMLWVCVWLGTACPAVGSAAGPGRTNKLIWLRMANARKLCKSTLGRAFYFILFFWNLVLMDPLFHVKVSPTFVMVCVTFTVLFVPLAK